MEFTENELLETINEMGYDLSSEELTFFKKEMDRFLDELEKEEEHQSKLANASFSSLNVPDALNSFDDDMFYAEQYCCISSQTNLHENKRINRGAPINSSTIENCFGKLDYDEILEILDNGYRCLQNITEDSERLRELNNRMEQSLNSSQSRLKLFAENKQNVSKRVDEEQEEKSNREEENGRTVAAVDPAIRPILHPLPGEAPFRHDPVKKYELYKKGWKENPPPGEKKRLSLRWKVREFMLRRDVPKVKPADLARRKISNPDWSPRPYLD